MGSTHFICDVTYTINFTPKFSGLELRDCKHIELSNKIMIFRKFRKWEEEKEER